VKLSERQAKVAELPWVRRLKVSPGRCQGYKYGHMPLKALYRMGSRPPVPGLKEKYRCTNAAWWRFRALKRSSGQDGDYCWVHLNAQLTRDQLEQDRLSRKLDELGWPLAPISQECTQESPSASG
jgi:hypothetical protein